MIELILLTDKFIFLFINKVLSNSFFDLIMPLIDNEKIFLPIMLIPFILTLIIDTKNRIKLAILIPITIILVDQTGLYLKKLILRPRPWSDMDLEAINHLVGKKGKNYSFPSNHAANMAGLSIVFSSIYKQYSKIFWFFTSIVMLSRVYIGVHYPSDVIAGCLLGSIYGLSLTKIWESLNYKKKINWEEHRPGV